MIDARRMEVFAAVYNVKNGRDNEATGLILVNYHLKNY